MRVEELRAKVRSWDLQHTGKPIAESEFESILDQLEYHADRDWRVYLPAEHPDFNANYMERLAGWVGNLANEQDQQLLLHYALFISFFSHDDFSALYRTALDREVTRWTTNQIGARLSGIGPKGFDKLIHQEIHRKT